MGVVAQGQRVRLRPLRYEDTRAIEPWYAEVAAAVHGGGLKFGEHNLGYQIEEARATGSGDVLVIERLAEAGPIGLLDYRTGVPATGWLTVGFIALAKAYRGWGHGSEAVRLLEEEALRSGVSDRFRAKVDVRNGLGLYFWLRLGYRPAGRDEFGWRGKGERDRMAMVRDGNDVRSTRYEVRDQR